MRRQIKFPFLLLLVIATLPAQAELTTAPPNFFLGVDAGIPFGTDQPALIRQGVVSRVGGSAEVNQDSIGINGRLFAGYQVTENIGIELSVFRTTAAQFSLNGTTASRVTYAGNASMQGSGFTYAAMLRPSVSTGWNQLFFRLGGHRSTSDTSTQVFFPGRSSTTASSSTGNGVQFGLGFDGRINERFDWRVQLVQLNTIGGVSGSNSTILSVGALRKF